MWKDFMSSKRRKTNNADATIDYREFRFDCLIDTAINPFTKSEVTLVKPVAIRCYEDFARFYDDWEDFCKALSDDPKEVFFGWEPVRV